LATTDQAPPLNDPDERREARSVIRDVVNPYSIGAAVLGVLAGIFAISVHKFVKDERTILLAMAGVAIALLAVVLTATALMAGFLQDFFGLVIQKASGLRAFFRPFRIIAWVSAAAALVGFGGAINADSGPEWLKAGLFGLAAALTTWTIVGTVWLISIFMDEAVEERKLETVKEQVRRKQKELDGAKNATSKPAAPPTPPNA
jgi:hypothetical protein